MHASQQTAHPFSSHRGSGHDVSWSGHDATPPLLGPHVGQAPRERRCGHAVGAQAFSHRSDRSAGPTRASLDVHETIEGCHGQGASGGTGWTLGTSISRRVSGAMQKVLKTKWRLNNSSFGAIVVEVHAEVRRGGDSASEKQGKIQLEITLVAWLHEHARKGMSG